MSTLDDALKLTADAEEVMVIGGGKIYEQMLPKADRIYMTRVHASVDGDTYIPDISEDEWQVVDEENFPADDSRQYAFSFMTLDKRGRTPLISPQLD